MMKTTIKTFVLTELAPHFDGELTDEVSLIGGGIIDSISTLQLVDFIEKEFGIEFEPHEVDRDNLDTLTSIETFITNKQ